MFGGCVVWLNRIQLKILQVTNIAEKMGKNGLNRFRGVLGEETMTR